MGKMKNQFFQNHYSNPFKSPWYSPKHAKAQVNGETQQTQSLIILENETRKNS
ncbi:YpzG family protein [Bacillus aquiflavi]|uniref:YpzG family protein n=1 Tax=Bacillus aquiflavi TaxID=2672567 RepID=A0A6B3VYP5_9BACI|nr:YpzG family protein [Bacillus aquiflavi]MBA4536328.1 YpzG family protein [Bacillus aquiflavi]NEY80696.1 YpzG family protein [Bacillus aquiflavi]UAC48838.1 YpzG family protein [Bacillus aquiflavi]